MPKKGWIIAGIVVLLLALALLIFKWVTAPIELDFEVRVTDAKLTDFVDEWTDIYKDKWEDYFSREEDFAVLQYEFEYWSDKDFHTDEHINLGVFFEVFYPNELNDRIFDYTRMKDFGFIYEKDKVNTYRIRVIVEREGLTDEQILEMGRQMQLKVFGLEKYNPDEMSKEMQQDERDSELSLFFIQKIGTEQSPLCSDVNPPPKKGTESLSPRGLSRATGA